MNWLLYIGGYLIFGQLLFALIRKLETDIDSGSLDEKVFGISWTLLWIWICIKLGSI
ncbi:hypothetical protein LCGC14_2926590, partial [marine sediment metagenome]